MVGEGKVKRICYTRLSEHLTLVNMDQELV